jgi:hypothetical protein
LDTFFATKKGMGIGRSLFGAGSQKSVARELRRYIEVRLTTKSQEEYDGEN